MNGTDDKSMRQKALRVAVVDADAAQRDAQLVPELERSGFEIEVFGDAAGFYKRALVRAFEILVVDIDLPDEDGLSIVAHMRESDPRMGIAVLATVGTRDGHMQALRMGADAYFSRPIDPELLVASLQCLARRMAAASGDQPKRSPRLPARREAQSGWRLASDGWSMVTPTGQLLALSKPERAVMMILDERRGQPVERERLVAALAPDAVEFDPHRLDALIHRIRRKAGVIAPDALPLPLLSVRGTGYVLGV